MKNEYAVCGGKRIHGKNNKLNDCPPLISIITSTFNAVKDLPWTIQSIRKQTYRNIQFVIADGASTDGTVDVLRQNEDAIDFWFSEPDTGIYNAWNKALDIVEGEWVIFLGAGDELASDTVFETIAQKLISSFSSYELVYGNKVYISSENRSVIERRVKNWKAIKDKWVFFRPELPDHGTVFHHKSVFKKYNKFDETLKIAGDSCLMLKSITKKTPLWVDVDVCKVIHGGVSSTIHNYNLMATEIFRINKALGINPPLVHWMVTKAKLFVKLKIVTYFPPNFAHKIMDLFRVMQGLEKRWSIK